MGPRFLLVGGFAALLIPVRAVANDCTFPQDFHLLRVDKQNKRLFIEGTETSVIERARIDSYLEKLDQAIGTCEPSWTATWSLSVFSNPKLAGYKTDSTLAGAVENGDWGRAYVAEYDRSTQLLTIFPLDSGKRRTRQVTVSQNGSREKSRAAREWLRFAPANSFDQEDTLDNSRWRTVLDSNESVAESMLQAVSSVPLTKKQAIELAGEFSLGTTTKAKPFLVRAVGSHVGTSGFEIHTNKNGDVTVIGGALSHHDIPPERRPIVVWLDQPPRELYLWFSVAE